MTARIPVPTPVIVIPAAGHATRLQPIAASKEMLTVAGRPLIEHLVERLSVVGPTRIRVVTRPEKTDLRDHAAQRGWEVVLGHPDHVAASLLLGFEGLADDEIVVVGFPDTLIDAPDAASTVLAALVDSALVGNAHPAAHPATQADVALGLFHTAEPWRGDVVTLVTVGTAEYVTSVVPKPTGPTDPARDLVWGLLAGRVGPLRALADVTEPGHLWDRWARQGTGRVRAAMLSGRYRDLGTRESLAELGINLSP
jgi:CTP:molybdopterin cytidylyltransferase MocA